MLIKDALTVVGGLSVTSKMPCVGYNLPASRCNVGGRLQQVAGSTCESCYAMGGQYRRKSVQNALERRHAIISAAIAPGGNYDEVVDAFVFILQTREKGTRRRLARAGVSDDQGAAWIAENGGQDHRYFRWHDSGDLINARHLAMICDIARRVPGVSFWIPTREYSVVRTFLALGGEIPDNLTVRLSAHMVDGKAPDMGLPTSTVSSGGIPGKGSCPAPTQGGECASCRECWHRDGNVDYLIH